MVKKEKYRTPIDAPFHSSSKEIVRNYSDFIVE